MRIAIYAASLIALSGCSDVGIGFAHHPGDCAMGIAWADCLPGTYGYAVLHGRAPPPSPQPIVIAAPPPPQPAIIVEQAPRSGFTDCRPMFGGTVRCESY